MRSSTACSCAPRSSIASPGSRNSWLDFDQQQMMLSTFVWRAYRRQPLVLVNARRRITLLVADGKKFESKRMNSS
ncbi:hypothetical protein [Mesorhizobium sp.]|uniref:hypothetical protein n=1 Tax=Mesorhizobium sp. TaxID=1871066 RepID=UPI0025E0F8B7|nr:hypothetical protein [Mesorhizobium sp.]